jgi:hypothetical protein
VICCVTFNQADLERAFGNFAALASGLARVDTDPSQDSRKRHFLTNYRQSGTRTAATHGANVTGDVYAGRAGFVARIGKLKDPGLADIGANTDTPFTVNAEVMVADEEGTIFAGRQLFAHGRRELIDTNVVHSSLQFALLIGRTKDTAFLH